MFVETMYFLYSLGVVTFLVKNALISQVDMLGDIFYMACSKLEAMAIYLVKQACGNDKLACVYIDIDKIC